MKIIFVILLIACWAIDPIAKAQPPDNHQRILLVLDVQEAYTKNNVNESNVSAMIAEINRLIDEYPADRVVYITSTPRVLVLTLKGIRIDTLENPGIDPRIHLIGNQVIHKNEPNAFTAIELLDYLEQHQTEKILITGLLAEKCIKASFLGGLDKGYHMLLVPEAILAKSDKSKKKVIKQLEKKGVVVL